MSKPAPQRDRASDASIIAQSLPLPAAFEAIFDRHFDAIHAFLARRAGRDRADDLAATTFTIAFERRATFRDRADARPWLYGIAINLLRNEWWSQRRAGDATLRLAQELRARATGENPSEDRCPALAEALARLDPDQRDVLLLHVWEGLRYAEIASALGIPVGTVRSRLSRARSHLRRALEPPLPARRIHDPREVPR